MRQTLGNPSSVGDGRANAVALELRHSTADMDNDTSPERPLIPGNRMQSTDHALKNEDVILQSNLRRYSASFFLLGLLNNVLYVIILSAALDLVPADVPKGVILFVNIFPALCVKIGWPYFVPGRVRYGRRVIGCSAVSFLGILLVAASSTLSPRLFGIALASFSSGLGEMTFLQRTTCYGNDDYAKLAVGWFSSGTGAAGLVGAGLWWELRNLGVKTGISISSVLPLCMGFVYFLLLPSKSALAPPLSATYLAVPTGDEQEGNELPSDGPRGLRTDMETDEVDDSATVLVPDSASGTMDNLPILKPTLTTRQKMEVAKPLFLPFMIPLFVVYFAEYTVNTGVSPNLLYPIPDPGQHPILGSMIHKLSDYYPLWQLVYQTFVFFSRSSSVIFHIPPLPARLIALPSVLQFGVLLVGIIEATHAIFTNLFGPAYAICASLVLVACEGLFGGTAYVNMYIHVGLIEDDPSQADNGEILARREFRMACVGFADTLGILAASLVSSWLEPTLCGIQVDGGRTLCREVK